MGSDREARAVAAAETIEVDGKRYKLRPVVIQHLCDLEREALESYKRRYLETFRRNADLLGGDPAELLAKKIEEVARWDLEDLPKKTAYDVRGVPLTDGIKQWLKAAYGVEEVSDEEARALLVTALESEKIGPKRVKELTGRLPLRGTVRYDQWWVTATAEGMIEFITSSLRYEHPEIQRSEVAQWPFGKIAEAARKVERITAAAVGNG